MHFEVRAVSEKGPFGLGGDFQTSCFNREKQQLFEVSTPCIGIAAASDQ